jgi:hypothetical protein
MLYRVTNIDLCFETQPNSDIYTAEYDTYMDIFVPDDVVDVEQYLNEYIVENIEVYFDTPDEPYYEISYAYFDFEAVV